MDASPRPSLPCLTLEMLVYGGLGPLLIVRLVRHQLRREDQHRQIRQPIHVCKQLRDVILQLLCTAGQLLLELGDDVVEGELDGGVVRVVLAGRLGGALCEDEGMMLLGLLLVMRLLRLVTAVAVVVAVVLDAVGLGGALGASRLS